jgi:hypothetical protein
VPEFKKYFNANPFDKTVWHHCHEDVGCECSLHPDPASFTKKKMVYLLRRLHYRRIPRVPRVKEWTALCTQYVFDSMLV